MEEYVYLVIEYDTFGYYVLRVFRHRYKAEELLAKLNEERPHSCGYDIEKHKVN